MGTCTHVLVNLGDVLEAGYMGEAGIDDAIADELVVGVGLLVIGAVRALQPFLARPVVAQVYHGRIAGGAGADDDHAALFAQEN